MRRPGYLGSLDDFWFGQVITEKQAVKSAGMDEAVESRLSQEQLEKLRTSTGAARYLSKHPAIA